MSVLSSFFKEQIIFSAHGLCHSCTSGSDKDDYEIKIEKRTMLHSLKK
jgi:hypothetical protein